MPPSTYRRKTQSQPSAEEMETTYQADLHWDLPLSTAASAAHSQPHQQVMIDNAGYGLFEPVAEDSGNSNFSAILSGQPAPQSQQQQVPGDFTPGAGAGTNEWYQQQNNTVYSDYSGLSAAQLSSPACSTPSQQSFSFPANPNPNTFDSSTGFHQLYHPDRHLPRFDFPGSTEQYTSSAPPTDMHYMSSPEQQYHRTQPIFSATSQAPLLGRQNITTGQSAPLTIVSPIKITSQESAGFNTGWGTVDTNVIAPDGSGSVGLRRLPGACRNCKRLKMKCIYEDGADICQRCKQTGKSESCVVECRRRGPALNKRELLMREIASRDQLIDSLLRQLHNPAMSTPINWPPTVPVPQQPTNTDRPLEQDVVAWIESTRQYRPPMLTGSIDARNNQGHTHLVSEPITSSTNVHPDDNAVSFGDNDSKVKDKGVSRLLMPAELRQDSAEIDDQLHLIDGTTAVGPIAKLSLGLDQRGSDAGMTGDAKEENEWVQVGNLTSFQTGSSANPEWRPVISERQMSPEILTGGIIKPNEVVKVLFEELHVSGSKHENESARDGDGSYDGWVWVADDWE